MNKNRPFGEQRDDAKRLFEDLINITEYLKYMNKIQDEMSFLDNTNS